MSIGTPGRTPARPAPKRVAPQFRIVAIPAAVALGAIGGIAAERVHVPTIVGVVGGALAAGLTVLALPSLPTRRATVLLLGIGGLGALRHASFAGTDRSWLLMVWAAATMLTLVLVDRADAERVPTLAGGRALPGRLAETARVSAFIALMVIVAAVALVPTVTARLGRHVWPGIDPSISDITDAPPSVRTSDELDLTSRPRLSDSVVFTVDAAREDFWRGETFDQYTGASWTRSNDLRLVLPRIGNDVPVTPARYDDGARLGPEFRQTFHIETGFTNIVFAAPSARVVQTDRLLAERPDGTVKVAGDDTSGFGKGAVYTVVSRAMPATQAMLRAATGPVPDAILAQYAQPPEVTSERVRALGRQITAGAATTYDKVTAIEAWLGENTSYSLNAPLSPKGVDVVDDFLFRSRQGWCEQIASSLVVLARSAGIPARLVTGFVPGDRDALTGRFVVRERHAHAWAEVFFPGIGWQGFDPTASVPLAGNASTNGSWLQSARDHAVPLGLAAVAVVLLVGFAPRLAGAARRRRARRASWAAQTLHRLERAGRKAGRARAPSETPREYARALGEQLGDDRLDTVGDALDVDAFSVAGASAEQRRAADAVLTSL